MDANGNGNGRDSIAPLARDVLENVGRLVKSELHLASLEAGGSGLTRHLGGSFFSGVVVSAAALSFVAFLIAGLAKLLGGNYWLSALIVSVVCAALGTVLGVSSYRGLKRENLSLPRTRESLRANHPSNGATHETERRTATG